MRVSKKNSKNFKKNVKRLAAYSAAAAATVLTTGSMANATEQIWDIPDTPLVGNGTFFNLTNGSFGYAATVLNNSTQGVFRVGSYYFPSSPGMYGPAYSTFAGIVGSGGLGTGYRFAALLGVSSSVGSGNSFAGNTSYPSYGNYAFLPDFTGDPGVVGLRFKLGVNTHYGWAMVTGPGGGMSLTSFGYNDTPDAASHPTNMVIPDPIEIALDIKPGPANNTVALNGNGTLRVAILASDELDVLEIDIESLLFGDPILVDGGATPLGATSDRLRDLNHDGLDDLLVGFSISDLVDGGALDVSSVEGRLTGELFDGTPIFGSDIVRMVPQNNGGGGLVISAVPEPSSILLLAAGAAGLGQWRRRRSNA